MSVSVRNTSGSVSPSGRLLWPCLLAGIAAIIFIFFDGFIEMEYRWQREEYSHGYMIPLVALFLFYQKIPGLRKIDWRSGWFGPVAMFLSLVGWFLGEMSSLFIIVHYAFLFAVAALVASVFGWRGFRLVWASVLCLVFMIPLPTFLYNGLSQQLQLISTDIGVAIIRMFDISVFVSGNIIDLGSYQLQVVEACSGLRYLFPLMSFGFLVAYLYTGPNWHKWVIFLSTLVITVLMNSFRIGVIGVTVEYWGIEMAEGFLHDFEGWVVFIACLGVLFLIILILNYAVGRKTSPLDLIDLYYPTIDEIRAAQPGLRLSLPALLYSTLLLLLAVPLSIAISEREEILPERTSFSTFPLLRGDWVGRESVIEPRFLEKLDHPDYIKASYREGSDVFNVDLYVAYYDSQRTGSSIHSPRSCIPGGGWKITDLTQENIGNELGFDGLEVNRLVISKSEQSHLVYYWFAQRGRVITNEYLAKWYLFLDGMTMQRSDGALVRLITPVPPGTDISEADSRLQKFLRDFYPIFPRYLPGRDSSNAGPANRADYDER